MKLTIPLGIVFMLAIVTYGIKFKPPTPKEVVQNLASANANGELVLPWGNLGKRMVDAGVIDAKKLEDIYSGRGGLNPEEKEMLYGNIANIKVTDENAPFVLNMLWALGLGNKNDILEHGEMMDPKYGGAANFASTGGWSLAVGDPMNHYSKYPLVNLNPEQQALVDKVSRNIYRPCCGNSTHFPDCNHGMAMLGALEILASKGAREKDLYESAYALNSLWFPEQYANINNLFKKENMPIDHRKMVGFAYSSGQGYKNVLSKVEPVQPKTRQGCGI